MVVEDRNSTLEKTIVGLSFDGDFDNPTLHDQVLQGDELYIGIRMRRLVR